MAGKTLTAFNYIAVPGPTPAALHDGTNTPGQPPMKLSGFIVQPTADTYLADSDVSETKALKILPDQTLNTEGFVLRGSNNFYDLSKLYYVGGPFTLIIERKADD